MVLRDALCGTEAAVLRYARAILRLGTLVPATRGSRAKRCSSARTPSSATPSPQSTALSGEFFLLFFFFIFFLFTFSFPPLFGDHEKAGHELAPWSCGGVCLWRGCLGRAFRRR